ERAEEPALLLVELLGSLVDHGAPVAKVPRGAESVGRVADLLEQLVRDVVAGPLTDELPGFRLVEGDDALLAADELRQRTGQPAVCLADIGHSLEGPRDLLEAFELPVASPGAENSAHRLERGRQPAHGPSCFVSAGPGPWPRGERPGRAARRSP